MNQIKSYLVLAIAIAVAIAGRAMPASAQVPGAAEPSADRSLRLTEVVARLPDLHLYFVSENSNGQAQTQQANEWNAVVGNKVLSHGTPTISDRLAVVFLVDVSRSLTGRFDLIRHALGKWINSLGPKDYAAVVTFGDKVKVAQYFSNDGDALERALPADVSDGTTKLYQGLIQAIDLARRQDRYLPLRRAVVVLTDGVDDQAGSAVLQEVYDKLSVDPVPIYAVGSWSRKHPVVTDAVGQKVVVNDALKQLADVARRSGGAYRRTEDLATVDRAFDELHEIVSDTYDVRFTCTECVPDGSATAVRLQLVQGTAMLGSQFVTITQVGREGLPSAQKATGRQNGHGDTISSKPLPTFFERLGDMLKQLIDLFGDAASLWILGGLSILVVSVTTYYVVILPKERERGNSPETPDSVEIGRNTRVKGMLIIPYGTNRDRWRLRLDAVGHSDIPSQEILFDQELSVGRRSNNDISISGDSQISGRHCSLSRQNGRIFVTDLESTNGTRVNGVPIKKTLHAETGSILGVGRTELRLTILPPEY